MKWIKAAALSLAVLSIVLLMALVGYGHYLNITACSAYGRETGQVTMYRDRVGCMVQRGDYWMLKR